MTQTMPSALTVVPENRTYMVPQQVDPVLQPVEQVENSSQNLSEHSLQSKESKKTNGVQFLTLKE